ncbi:MAG: cysteine hydrolase [Solobacterium sp.]|nr:cysteine hydrolase [Solobacterium sp.]
MKVLVIVDMQKDFVDGSLGSKAAEAIVDNVCALIQKEFDRIYVTMDTHGEDYLDTLEGRYLPVSHCIKNTDGWLLDAKVAKALEGREHTVIEKPTFGSFELADQVAADDPDEIVVCGLCTDICVVSNALLLRARCRQKEIIVEAAACAGTSAAKHEAALAVMQSCQIQVH